MKGIIYIRVSSDEQVKGTSLDSQEAKCRAYCADKDIQVEQVFREEGESAKTADRTELLKALSYCRKQRGKITAFVVYKVDRFARNAEDHFAVKTKLASYGTKLHSATEAIGDDPVSKLLETILAGYSDFDNAVRKQRCTEGMSAKIEQGLYPWNAPVGYISRRARAHGKKKTQPDSIDPDTFPVLQTALREYAAGVHQKQSDLSARLDELGLGQLRGRKTYRQFVALLLDPKRVKFYGGIIENPWTGRDEVGLHKAMLSRDEVDAIIARVQAKKRPQRKRQHNPTFPLRGFVFCGECKRPYTAGTSRGRGGLYNYYYCGTKTCPLAHKTVLGAKLESTFLRMLSALTPGERFLRLLKRGLSDRLQTRTVSQGRQAKICEGRLRALEAKRERVLQLGEDGVYDKQELVERKRMVEGEIADERVALTRLEGERDGLHDRIQKMCGLMGDLRDLWHHLRPDLRGRLMGLMFASPVSFNRDDGFQTPKYTVTYDLFRGLFPSLSILVHRASRIQDGGESSDSAQEQKMMSRSWSAERLTQKQETFFDTVVDDHRLELLEEIDQWAILHDLMQKKNVESEEEKKAA